MIISVSRRTDIPSFYSEWFLNRIREKFVLVPNPFNPKQVSRVSLTPDVVDCIVFWTKNPAPMLDKLDQLENFKYYFQFTLNPYGKEIEANLPSLDKRIDTFKRLSDRIGKEKVIWRYDPILTNEKYNTDFHKTAFAEIATRLKDYTEKCMLGFIDHYKHIHATLRSMNIGLLTTEEIQEMAISFRQTIDDTPLLLNTCTVKIDLTDMGIPAGMCIDRELVERITGYPISTRKDKNQRDVCRCIESIDIGTYDTCFNGCLYCYANTAEHKPLRNRQLHDPASPKLVGQVKDDDIIKDRITRSLRRDPTLF
ncbi:MULTISPECIES: DUF1848 domain-containing protein [Odoribacteraceae]|uniref:DUF1848 domain-containing protein n=1 Tax=Odoribacteraceae TaxID=1853231 RepID=UPI000E4A1F59|nr:MULTISPECIES: DUF1848 domain-containing protein [Odoribacteraceae]MCQ4874297.1 DUF1848 domain-containing protein [Butyricimonas paravirosa]RHR77213.1 DUF1848 domain-containing protein [Odoribacter sp. AF15-53]